MKGWVYFARLADDGPIKIGKAFNPRRRVASLASISPHSITLLAAMHCDDAAVEEQQLHEKLAADCIKSEWFAAEAVLEEMRRLAERLVPLERLPTAHSRATAGKNVMIRFRATEEEMAAWVRRANRAGVSLSEWVRGILNTPKSPFMMKDPRRARGQRASR